MIVAFAPPGRFRGRQLKKMKDFIAAQGELTPEYYQLNIQHDDWCPGLHGGRCRCDPDFSLSQPQKTVNS